MPDLFSIDLGFWPTVLFVIAGVLTGIINTLAGSGSLITLPIFIFVCGLPAPVANGTNRIGAIIQSAVGLYAFRRSDALDLTGASWLLLPSVLGALVGSRIAVTLDEQMMNYTIGGLMVFMLLVLLVNPKRWIHNAATQLRRNRHPLTLLVFFAIGVYGGFIQAGVGIFLLAGLVLISRYTLQAGNGVKLLIVFSYCIPALAVFFWHGQVHIGYGLAMAVFQSIGSWVGVRFAVRVPNADVWIHRLLIVMVAGAAFKFFFSTPL